MSVVCTFIRLSLVLMASSIFSSIEFVHAQDAEALIFSGDPPVYPKMAPAGSGPITTIKGDLVIENFDARTFASAAAKSGFAPYGEIEKITGTVTIRNLTAPKLSELTFLKEIGGDLIIHNNPNLQTADFLSNNVSVKGSIEGKNNAKLCSRYSYLITVDDKYFNLFDDDCLTMPGDVDILMDEAAIGEKRIIKGSLICVSANNPKFRRFDGALTDSLNNLVGVGSLILDDCPITSLSSTLPSLKKVDTAVKIINCGKLDDDKFSDWLHKLKTDPSKMILKNNDNVCLDSNHVEEWKNKQAQISEYTLCAVADTTTKSTVKATGFPASITTMTTEEHSPSSSSSFSPVFQISSVFVLCMTVSK